MIFEESLREAAKRAERAVDRAMRKYRDGHVTDEDDITGVLVGNLDAELEGQIAELRWTTSVVRHRSGDAAEEKRVGADIVIHVSLKSKALRYSKGILVQAKRVEPGIAMGQKARDELVAQCNRMLAITPASFVFDYARGSMRCGSAAALSGMSKVELYSECVWTPYRFFLELFRCPVGDVRLTSALVSDLPISTVVDIRATALDF